MTSGLRAGLAAACTLAALSAAAQQAPPTPEQQAQSAIEVRQSVFTLMGWNMDPLAAMARNRIPFDAAAAKTRAARIEQLAAMITDSFQPDTRKFKGETKALPNIWDSKDTFNGKAGELVKAAQALSAAAASGDKAATLKAIGGVGRACGSCHDDFREED
jgi:cytochrome c556